MVHTVTVIIILYNSIEPPTVAGVSNRGSNTGAIAGGIVAYHAGHYFIQVAMNFFVGIVGAILAITIAAVIIAILSLFLWKKYQQGKKRDNNDCEILILLPWNDMIASLIPISIPLIIK